MHLIWLMIILLVQGAFYAITFKRDITVMLPLSFFIILIQLFLSGVIGYLFEGVIFIYLETIVMGIGLIIYGVKCKDVFKSYVLKPSVLYVIMLICISFLLFRYSHFISWDEFSHWGIYPRNVVIHDKLFANDFTSHNNGYPPIISIAQYFLIKIRGSYVEADLFRMKFIFGGLILMPLLTYIPFKQIWKWLLFAFIFAVAPILFFKGYLYDIYIDDLLGVLFAVALLYLVIEKITWFRYIKTAIILSMLVLMKEFGLVLTMIYYVVLFIDMVLFRRKMHIAFYKEYLRTWWQKAGIALVLLIPLILRQCWSIYIASFNTVTSQYGSLNIKIPPYFYQTLGGYVETVTKSTLSIEGNFISAPTIIWVVGLAALMYMSKVYLIDKRYYKIFKITSYIIVIASLLYIFILFLAYIFLFPEYESVRLASFARYIYTILLSMYLLSNGVIWVFHFKGRLKNSVPISLSVLSFLLMFNYLYFTRSLIKVVNGAADFEVRKAYEANIEDVKTHLNEGDSVFFIHQWSKGYEYYINRYLFTPYQVQKVALYELTWSIGSPQDIDDVWTVKMSVEEWTAILMAFDYVYLDHVNELFLDEFGVLFDNKENIRDKTLFKVIKDGEKITLQQVR